jgi:hypothetical protein
VTHDTLASFCLLMNYFYGIPRLGSIRAAPARIFLAGLASSNDALLPGSRPNHQHLEEGFSASMGRRPRR